FETARYQVPPTMPAEWPVPPAAYDPDAGAEAYQGMVERVRYVEELGFDWVSVSEHHYSPRILTPNIAVSASYIAARSKKIKIAVLGPIVSQTNPVQVAEELAMLDNLAQGRLVVGLLRGTTNEYLTFGLNPAEARERTTEGMELILKVGPSRSPSAGKAAITSTAPCRSGRGHYSNPCRPPIRSARAVNPARLPRGTISGSVSLLRRSRLSPSRRGTTARNASVTAGSPHPNRCSTGQTFCLPRPTTRRGSSGRSSARDRPRSRCGQGFATPS